MGRGSRRRRFVVALAGALAAGGGVQAAAQILPVGPSETTQPPPSSETTQPPPPSTTTTTAGPGVTLLPTTTTAPPPETSAPDETTTTAPPPSAPAPAPPPAAPDPGAPAEGEGGLLSGVPGLAVPPDAQAVIDSIARTGSNDNHALVEGAALLESAGVAHDQAVRAVFGRFPILGPSRWSDDWYYPRWTGTQFRFHQGLDMFAAYGTPVVAPVDGVARIGQNALGGLTVRVVEPDGTYWYLAHLSGIAAGLVDGQPVAAGQVVGYVGDSGNAKGGVPHLHLGVYPQGGGAAPPKPIIDGWVADGAARVPVLLAELQAAAPAAPDAGRPLAAADVGPPAALGPSRGELLWASAANPTGGALQIADAAAAAAGRRLDWARRAAEQRALDLAWQESVDRARRMLAPLVTPGLRQAVEALGPS